MGRSVDAEQLRETERRRLRALVDGDIPVADPLHAVEYQLISPLGTALDKEEYLGGIASGRINYHVFEPASDIAVIMGSDIACVRYRARIEITVGAIRSDITVGTDRGVFWHTDIYRDAGDGWQALWSQATRINE